MFLLLSSSLACMVKPAGRGCSGRMKGGAENVPLPRISVLGGLSRCGGADEVLRELAGLPGERPWEAVRTSTVVRRRVPWASLISSFALSMDKASKKIAKVLGLPEDTMSALWGQEVSLSLSTRLSFNPHTHTAHTLCNWTSRKDEMTRDLKRAGLSVSVAPREFFSQEGHSAFSCEALIFDFQVV